MKVYLLSHRFFFRNTNFLTCPTSIPSKYFSFVFVRGSTSSHFFTPLPQCCSSKVLDKKNACINLVLLKVRIKCCHSTNV